MLNRVTVKIAVRSARMHRKETKETDKKGRVEAIGRDSVRF